LESYTTRIMDLVKVLQDFQARKGVNLQKGGYPIGTIRNGYKKIADTGGKGDWIKFDSNSTDLKPKFNNFSKVEKKVVKNEYYGDLIYTPIATINMIDNGYENFKKAIDFWQELRKIVDTSHKDIHKTDSSFGGLRQIFTVYGIKREDNEDWYEKNKNSDAPYIVKLRSGESGYQKKLPMSLLGDNPKQKETILKLFEKYEASKNIIYHYEL